MKLNSANGMVDAQALGPTLMHEHLVAGFPGWECDTTTTPLKRADVIKKCVDRIQELQNGGFKSLLDPCPSDLGRDAELYGEVAARTGFNILFATGLYHEQYSSPYWRMKLAYHPDAVNALSDMYIEELTNGVGPSKLKPAVIKLAIGVNPQSDYENKLIAAAARASNETGAPILAHTEGVGGGILLQKLTSQGVPAHKLIVGHSDGSADKTYHRAIVDGGAYIGLDRFGLQMTQKDSTRVECMHALIESGFAQHILVSHDCVFCMYGNMLPKTMTLEASPLHYTRMIEPQLRALGVPQATLDEIVTANPRRYFMGQAPAREQDNAGGVASAA